jgi:glucose-6-phosphate 1-epimerase
MPSDSVSLANRFAIPGVLWFDVDHNLTRLHIKTHLCEGTVYLQGAHVTHWKPTGQAPVIFLSPSTALEPSQPLRGGIPIVFPWFAGDKKKDRINGHPGPSHGFARIQDWILTEVHHSPQDLSLKFTLGPTPMSQSMGFDHFLLTMEMVFVTTLHLRLTVTNTGTSPLQFEEAFHAYFNIADVHETYVTGLEKASYLDKTDHGIQKPATGQELHFTETLDRVYLNTATGLTIHAGAQRRLIHIVKQNSLNTVVWNPWKALPDVGEWSWHEMLCVETANVGDATRTADPGSAFTMGMVVSVKPLPAPA